MFFLSELHHLPFLYIQGVVGKRSKTEKGGGTPFSHPPHPRTDLTPTSHPALSIEVGELDRGYYIGWG